MHEKDNFFLFHWPIFWPLIRLTALMLITTSKLLQISKFSISFVYLIQSLSYFSIILTFSVATKSHCLHLKTFGLPMFLLEPNPSGGSSVWKSLICRLSLPSVLDLYPQCWQICSKWHVIWSSKSVFEVPVNK